MDYGECLRCGDKLCQETMLCPECHEEEKVEEVERSRGPQTLADVGMCENDFR
jgi:uncharacterized OB-fold protein